MEDDEEEVGEGILKTLKTFAIDCMGSLRY